MEKLTREQAIENHRKLWNWIADKTLRQERKVYKWEYPPFASGEHECLRHCYACEYGEQADLFCDECIIDWGDSVDGIPLRDCCSSGSLYREWNHCDDYKRAAKLAQQIAELPERKV